MESSQSFSVVPAGSRVTLRSCFGEWLDSIPVRADVDVRALSLSLGGRLAGRMNVPARSLHLVWSPSPPDGFEVNVVVRILRRSEELDRRNGPYCFCCYDPCIGPPGKGPRGDGGEGCYRCTPEIPLCTRCRIHLPEGWCCFECLTLEDLAKPRVAHVAQQDVDEPRGSQLAQLGWDVWRRLCVIQQGYVSEDAGRSEEAVPFLEACLRGLRESSARA